MDRYGSGPNSYCEKAKTVSAGNSYTFKVWANDSIGNLGNESERTFSVQSASTTPPSSGGGGGGGGAATSFETWIKNVLAGQTIELDIDDEDIPYINGLSLTAKQDIYSSKLAITDLDKKPWYSMEEPDATVFRYFKVNYDKDNYVETAKLRFSINKSWLKDNDIDPYKFSLYRYTNTWEELDSEILDEDDKNIYFEVTTTGFSYFSLGGSNGSGYRPIKKEEEETPTVTTTTTIPEQPTATTTTTIKPAPKKTVTPPPVPPTEGKKKVLYILGILVVLILAAMLYVKKDEIDEIWRNR